MSERTLSEAVAGLAVEDVSVDEEGRVTINNPEIARKLEAVVRAPKPPVPPQNGTNCSPNASACHPNLAECKLAPVQP
jgi:hypothetical protein